MRQFFNEENNFATRIYGVFSSEEKAVDACETSEDFVLEVDYDVKIGEIYNAYRPLQNKTGEDFE